MRRHAQNSTPESSAASNVEGVGTPRVSVLARIAKWCRRAWLRARGGLRNANGKISKQFAALSERQSSTRAEVQRLETAFRELCANVDTLHARIHELEAQERGSSPSRGGLALNLNARSQILKLSRNGQSARAIASTLGVPVGEVELLLKVQRLVNRAASRQQEQTGDGGRRPGPAPATVPLEACQTPCEPIRIQ